MGLLKEIQTAYEQEIGRSESAAISNDSPRLDYPITAELLLASSADLDTFFYEASRYDEWYAEEEKLAREQLPDHEPGWAKMSDDEKEALVYDWIQESENNESSTMVFFRNPRWLPRGTWLVRFTDKDPVTFAQGLMDGTISGVDPERAGLTFHEHAGDGNICFAFTLSEAPINGHTNYGGNAVLLQVEEAVEASHRSDGEEQAVFDIEQVDLVIPMKKEGSSYIVMDEKGKQLFRIKQAKGIFEKILEKIYGKGAAPKQDQKAPDQPEMGL